MNRYYDLGNAAYGIDELVHTYQQYDRRTLWVVPKFFVHTMSVIRNGVDAVNIQSLHKKDPAAYNFVAIHAPMPAQHTKGFKTLVGFCEGKHVVVTSLAATAKVRIVEAHVLWSVSARPDRVSQYMWGKGLDFKGQLVHKFVKRR